MSLVLMVSLVLVACHPGKASIIRPSAEEATEAQSPLIIRTNRCLGDPLQSARKAILDSLNLQTEPRVSVPGMDQIREQWRNVFKGTGNSDRVEQHGADNTPPSAAASSSSSSSSSPSFGNSTHLQCCMFASQIFIKDLAWDEWVIYPESFTFVQCGVCVPQQNQRVPTCRDDDPSAQMDPPSQKPCCEATSHDSVPFLYLDETNTLVISSVPQTRECGCDHGDDPQALQP